MGGRARRLRLRYIIPPGSYPPRIVDVMKGVR